MASSGGEASSPVVSNTTPLITLAEIGLLDIVEDLYGELWIPTAVFREYQAGIPAHGDRPPLSNFPGSPCDLLCLIQTCPPRSILEKRKQSHWHELAERGSS